MDPAVATLLKQGIAAARAGRRAEARTFLRRVLDNDAQNEQALLWLAGVSDDAAEVRASLHAVLERDPNNAAAKKGLDWAEQRFGPEPLLERAVGEVPAAPAPSATNPMTTTTVSMEQVQVDQRVMPSPGAAPLEKPAPSPPTSRLREGAVFDPLNPRHVAAPPARATNRPSTERLRDDAVFDPLSPVHGPIPPKPAPERATRPAAPTMLMEAVAPMPAVAAAPPLPVAAQAPVLAAPPAPAPAPARPAAPAEPIIAAPPENPCPYCGAPTTIKQQRCTQCRSSLMERAPRAERRSLALTVLGGIWMIGGVGMLVGAALLGVLLFLQRQAPAGAALPSGFLAIVLAAVFLFGLLCFGVARGLLARVREFYFLNIALILIGIVVRVGLLVRGVALLSGIMQFANSNAGPWSGVLSTIALVLPIVLGTLLVLFPLILSILSYRDFFPPLVRSNPTVERGDHVEHYNRGLSYRDRGMWYMVAQEWFTATRMRPGERAYLPALGLAYAQIRKLYPNSRAYLSDVEAFLRGRKAELYAAAPELERMKLLD